MSSLTQKYTIYLPNASAYYFTADSDTITADSSLTCDSILSAFTYHSATLPNTYGYATADSTDVTVDDDTITVDWVGNLQPYLYFTIYLPTYIGTSFTADSTLTADSLITADTTII